MKTLLVIVGPTGVGKTELTLQVAEHLGVPVINADSRQIYAEIPIGTAAPTKEQQCRVRHFFVGSHHLTDYYSASLYEQDVLQLLGRLFDDADVALMSGGSMMYIDAVCEGIDDIPTIDAATRSLMRQRLKAEGLPALADELRRKDAEYWEIVDKRNPRRVVHALEICYMTGKTYTSFRTHTRKRRPFRIVKIGLNRSRASMYDRINHRVLDMVSHGLVEEALGVYKYRSLNALNTVGYKEMFEYLDGLTTLDEAVFKIQSNTRRYMRKQLTWFKKDQDIQWMNPDNIKEIIKYIDDSL